MPFDSNGNHTLPGSYFVENGDTVLPVQHNPPLEDISASLSSVILRSGVAPMGGNLKMGDNKITGVAAGTATTDAVNKGQLDQVSFRYSVKTGNYKGLVTDNGALLWFTGAAPTLTLDPAATLGANWNVMVKAAGGDLIIDPNASEQVNGVTTVTIKNGTLGLLFCDGTGFKFHTDLSTSGGLMSGDLDMGGNDLTNVVLGGSIAGPIVQGFFSGLAMTTNATDAPNDVDFAAGAAAADASPYYLMQFAALTKRLDATFTAGNNGGMLDAGVVGNGPYYLFGIGRSDTGATDFLGSLSSTAPAMPAGYDRKRLIGGLTRTAGVNSAPNYLLDASKKVRASVNFNGTGTLAIRDAMDFLGVTDNGVGQYAPVFATPAPHANYSVIASCRIPASGGLAGASCTPFSSYNGSAHVDVAPTTAGFAVKTYTQGANNQIDSDYVMLAVIW